MAIMIDRYGREITDLRISVTQRCNLNCSYCHKEGEIDSKNEMSVGAIQELVTCASKLGIKNVKITGGEPLLRKDILEIIEKIKQIDGIKDVSLVTNGTLLEEFAESLKKAGLNRVNISCDSYSQNPVSFKYTKNILPGLLAAKMVGLYPIKLNMVILKDINHHEIDRMIEFAGEHDVILQLIELIPNGSEYYENHYFSLDAIERELGKKAIRVETRKMQARKQYYLNSTGFCEPTVVEIVRPTHKLFCENCTKLRVTSDGKIKPCLMRDDNLVDFKDESSFIEAVNRKTVYNS